MTNRSTLTRGAAGLALADHDRHLTRDAGDQLLGLDLDVEVDDVALGITPADPSTWTVTRSRQRVDRENTILANQTSVNSTLNLGGLEHDLAAGVELLYEKEANYTHSSTGTTTNANLYNPNPNDPMAQFGGRNGGEAGGERAAADEVATVHVDLPINKAAPVRDAAGA